VSEDGSDVSFLSSVAKLTLLNGNAKQDKEECVACHANPKQVLKRHSSLVHGHSRHVPAVDGEELRGTALHRRSRSLHRNICLESYIDPGKYSYMR
jgi:hypothetical protein